VPRERNIATIEIQSQIKTQQLSGPLIKEAVVTAFVAVERTLVAGIRHGFGE